ncbi:MAG: hypothetical protein IJ416_08435 [Ruminiclostridium sp.]|nr:hypothetical protein [Ruminiclostridium sp.]
MKKNKNQAVDELKEMSPMIIGLDLIIVLSITVIGFSSGFDYRLYTGLIAGNVLMIANFLIIGITAGAITRTRQFKRGQFLANFSYGARYIGIFVILALLLTFELISPFTAVIPLFFPKLYYTIQAFRGKYNDD